MAICQFFLQGRCRFGERCWNEHPRGGGRHGPSAPHYQGTSRGGGGGTGTGWGTTHQRHTNVIQPSTFKSNTWGGSRDHGRGFFGSSDFGSSGGSSRNADFSQNKFSALMNSQNIADGCKDEEERLLECVVKDMDVWESSGQWIFSCYSPMKEKPNVSGFPDFSPEELRLEYYNCRENNNIQNYVNSVQQLAKQWKNRLLQLKALNASTKAALLSELKSTVTQPLSAFGFGGQQTSSFGLSSFAVNSSSSNTASSFSFKTNSRLVIASSGNAPTFGSSSAACNPAAVVTSSPSVSHSAGFGNLAVAPSAASFSFKTSETASGFGTSGFSGSGNSAVNSSSAFGAPTAAVAASSSQSSSTLVGQSASTSGHNTTSASSADTNNTTSEKLFTPKSELSAEELKQFEAKKFTLGKIPLKPPPLELLSI
ncbi:nucleoporin NUP42 isoform X2 [Balearica regulorum gibbericeps]|uniref:nucleoporin NUP42 isoform X2 n=1 Tax=Balearica regulorum gibbericeps TaxID=100784 RepID=UPI003F61AE87